MNSFVTALSDSFGVDSGQVRLEAAGVEIDRFDGWRLAASDAVVAYGCSATRILRCVEQSAGA